MKLYERRRPESISQQEYEKYLSNSGELAFKYGTDSQFFARNKAEVDWSSIKYIIKGQEDTMSGNCPPFYKGDLLVISNSYAFKIRTDKVVSEVLHLTRSRVKGLEKSGAIIVKEEKQEHKIIIRIDGEINNEEII